MKNFLIFIILNILFFSKAIGATANCSGGECDFDNSFHYKSAKTYCAQNINYEDVETNYLYFIIIQTGQKCDVFETQQEN